jgi:predicted nuclease of predicted toxin-antitoxin system
MRFLLDAQLPPGLVGPLTQSGHECVHVTQHLAGDASDAAVAELAGALDAVLMTKDADFFDLSTRGILKAPLVWVRCGNMTTRRLWERIEPLLPTIVAVIEEGQRVVEIR